jgi:Ca2+-binding RTX toxin-like protein
LNNTLRGNATGNSLDGDSGDDTLIGESGNDTLIGGSGNDSMVGGADDDYYIIDSSSDAVVEAASGGTDSVLATFSGYTLLSEVEWLILDTGVANGFGSASANSILGNTEANSLSGGGGNDSLYGGAGADTLDGGAEIDTMVGGTESDYYLVGSVSDSVVESVGEGTDSVYATIGNYILGENIEHLELGTGIIAGSGNIGNETLLGNAIGNSLSGASGNDTLLGLAGNDTLDGGSGDDSLVGGEGSDLYYLDSMSDVIIEVSNQGTDSILASISGYTLASQVEYLELLDGVLSGTGNSLANTLTGNSIGNSLDGGIGNDRMVGGDGNDTYFADSALDLVVELADEGSSDLVVSSVSDWTLSAQIENLMLSGSATLGTGNSLDNLLTANALLGSTLYGGGGEDTFVGGAGNDWFIVDSSGDSVEGGLGTDSVQADFNGYTLGGGAEWLIYGTAVTAYGNNSANTLVGNSLANTLDGRAGADSMAGGIGNDYYFVDDLGDVVLESSLGGNSDTIFININGYIVPSHIENITIGESIADVTGNSANNILVGNSLNNTLNGGAGADTLVGGDGNDYYIVDNVGDVATELNGVSSGTDSVLSNIGYYALGNHIEYLTLGIGAVTGAGNSLDNTLVGNSGPYNSLFGGAGDDWLDGSSQISGKNTLNGGTGSDTMIGSAQNDWFVIDHAGDSIVGGGGTDGIISELDGYTLQVGFNALALGNGATVGSGNSGNNSLTGNSLNNTLNGGDGADTLMGGIGIDYYYINSSDDVVIELAGYGTDTIEVSGITSYTLAANTEKLVLGAGAVNGTGTSLNNTLTGNTANNSLFGAAGNDSLFGGDGADTLVGTNASVRNEIDTLTGGSGADLFILGNSSGIFYNDAYNSQTGTTDYALITDFNSGEDSLQLKSGTYYFGAASGGYQNLFYDITTTTYQDEVIARFQGTAFATTSFSNPSGLAGLNVTWV